MISVTKQAANLLAMIAAGAFLAGMFHNQPMGFIVGTLSFSLQSLSDLESRPEGGEPMTTYILTGVFGAVLTVFALFLLHKDKDHSPK